MSFCVGLSVLLLLFIASSSTKELKTEVGSQLICSPWLLSSVCDETIVYCPLLEISPFRRRRCEPSIGGDRRTEKRNTQSSHYCIINNTIIVTLVWSHWIERSPSLLCLLDTLLLLITGTMPNRFWWALLHLRSQLWSFCAQLVWS